MTRSDFLKIAHMHGLGKAAGEVRLTGEENDILVKHALNFGRLGSRAKGIFQRGAKEAPVAEAAVAPAGAARPAQTSLDFAAGHPSAAQKTQQQIRQTAATAPAGQQTGLGFQRPTAPAPSRQMAPPPKPAAPAPKAPGPPRIEGEGFWGRRKRIGTARQAEKVRAATPHMARQQTARTGREIGRAQRQATKENIRRESQAALAKEQEALRAAQAEQQAAVQAEKVPARAAAPAAEGGMQEATKATKATAEKGTQEAAGASAAGTAAGRTEAAVGTQAAKETGAKAEEGLAQRYEEARAAMPGAAEKQLGEVAQQGATGSLGFMPATLAPAALGAGVGYAADGREGALVGAGLGLGARAGMGPLLRRLREARGFQKMLGGSAGAAWSCECPAHAPRPGGSCRCGPGPP